MTQTYGQVLGASTDWTSVKLADLQSQIDALKIQVVGTKSTGSFSGGFPSAGGFANNIALTQRIDQLSGTSLSNITVNGISGLTDADIPDSVTASAYLPLAGGTLAGDLTLTGNLTVSGAQTLSGAITIPYLTATSTTVASLFQGGLFSQASSTIGDGTQAGGLTISGGATTTGNAYFAGNVGIGTASLSGSSVFNINNTSAVNPLEIHSANAHGMNLYTHSDTAFRAPVILFYRSRGTQSSPSAVVTGDQLGYLQFGGYNSGNANYITSSNITSVATGDFTSTNIGNADLTFSTNNNGSGLLERMRIASGGNVGIGTTTPWGRLSITGSGATSATYGLVVADSNNSPKMVVRNDGNVGIAQTSPTYKLDVTGLGHFTGLVDAQNFVATSSSATSTFAGDIRVGSTIATNVNNGQLVFGTPTIGTTVNKGIYMDSQGVISLSTSIDPTTLSAANLLNNFNNFTGLVMRRSGVGSGSFIIGQDNSGNDQFSINGIGGAYFGSNVGIGTTTPWGRLSIKGAGTGTGKALVITDSSNVERMVVQDNGNVGIGTTTPQTILSVAPSTGNAILSLARPGTGYTANIRVQDAFDNYGFDVGLLTSGGSFDIKEIANGATPFSIVNYADTGVFKIFGGTNNNGQASTVGIASTTPFARLSVKGGAASGLTFQTTNSSNSPTFSILDTGNVGIGTTSPWKKLAVTGTVGFDGLTAGTGAGSLCLSANNEVTYSAGAGCTGSSQRFKHDIVPLDASSSLDTALKLSPVSFVYNDDIGVKGPQVGLIAEQVQQAEPRLVATDASGTPFTVKYENLTAILAGAIQKLFSQLSTLAATVASFADHFTTRELTFTRATGDDLTVKRLNADETTTGTLCVRKSNGTDACITGDQLAALLSQSAAAGLANPSPTPIDPASAEPLPTDTSTSPVATESAQPVTEPTTPIADSPPIVPDQLAGQSDPSTSESIPVSQ